MRHHRQPPARWLYISEAAGAGPEDEVVCTFLHELAHAFYAIEDGYRAAHLQPERAEAAAWSLAASWAAHGCLSYEYGFDVVARALDEAARELDRWVLAAARAALDPYFAE